jgi:hypothetical protein
LNSNIQLLLQLFKSNISNFQFSIIQVFKYSSFQIFKFSNTQIFKYSSFQTFNNSSFQMFNFSNIQIFKYSSFQLFKFSNIQVFKFSNIQIFKNSNFQLFNLNIWSFNFSKKLSFGIIISVFFKPFSKLTIYFLYLYDFSQSSLSFEGRSQLLEFESVIVIIDYISPALNFSFLYILRFQFQIS